MPGGLLAPHCPKGPKPGDKVGSTSPSPPRGAGEAAASPRKGALEQGTVTLDRVSKKELIFPGKSLCPTAPARGARAGRGGAGSAGAGARRRPVRMLERRRVYVTWGGGTGGGPVESRIPGIRALRWVREAGDACG